MTAEEKARRTKGMNIRSEYLKIIDACDTAYLLLPDEDEEMKRYLFSVTERIMDRIIKERESK